MKPYGVRIVKACVMYVEDLASGTRICLIAVYRCHPRRSARTQKR